MFEWPSVDGEVVLVVKPVYSNGPKKNPIQEVVSSLLDRGVGWPISSWADEVEEGRQDRIRT